MHSINRPLASLVIFAQLALALQPLSVLAQEKGKANISPMAQSQINRINLLNRDIEAAKVKKVKEQASPADQTSADLERIEELTKNLHIEPKARTAKSNQRGAPNEDNARRTQHSTELKDLLVRQQNAHTVTKAEFDATRAQLQQKLKSTKFSSEILARHDKAVGDFEQRSQQFKQISQRFEQNHKANPRNEASKPNSAVEELHTFFTQYPNSKRAAPSLNPNLIGQN